MRKPSYQTIYEDLMNQIISGKLGEGEQLPTEPGLAAAYQVSIGTLRRAVEKLEFDKFLKREQGRGTFVCKIPEKVVSPSSEKRFNFGVLQPLTSQPQINELIFGDTQYKQLVLPTPLDIKPTLSKLWQQCSLVQIPLTAFALPEMQGYLAPLPPELGMDCPDEILRECRTFYGELRLLPIIANPTVCYIWKPGLAAAGLQLPAPDWTLNELLEYCRRLKSVSDIAPFGLLPFPSLLYEILLWHFGGDFYDAANRPWLPEAAFNSTVQFVQQLYQEKLCFNPFGKRVTINDLFNRPLFQIGFYGPNGLSHLERSNDWCLQSLPGHMGCQVVFGLAIPHNAPDPETALQILRSLTAESRLQQLSSCTPAAISTRRAWCSRQSIDCTEILMQMPSDCHILSGNQGFERWRNEIYPLFNDAVFGPISIEAARISMLRVLESKRVSFGESNFFS